MENFHVDVHNSAWLVNTIAPVVRLHALRLSPHFNGSMHLGGVCFGCNTGRVEALCRALSSNHTGVLDIRVPG